MVFLRDAECSKVYRQEEKLREVRPGQVTRCWPAKKGGRRDLAVHFRPSEIGQFVEVGERSGCERLAAILRKGNVAGQGHPVVFHHLACPLCTGQGG